jgi:Iap family predicted aminopeptidase
MLYWWMTRQRKPLHQSQRPLQRGGEKDEVAAVGDDKQRSRHSVQRIAFNCQRVGIVPVIRWLDRWYKGGHTKISLITNAAPLKEFTIK